jgi:aminoglycoside phosphotransferase family enzyme/predicted kinase
MNGNTVAETWNQAEKLAAALSQKTPYPHSVTKIEMIETHISWVFLTGPFAYKIKKPIDLGFVDYTTLKRREHFCHEELRLNRRLAPEIYLAVVPITGTVETPSVEGSGEPIEFAVKMRQFEQSDLLTHYIERKQLTPPMAEEIAHRMARFHRSITRAPENSPHGTPQAVLGPMKQNFITIRAHLSDWNLTKLLDTLEQWVLARHRALAGILHQRKALGFIRECHGDMHLGNIALVDGKVTIFDGIEFNDQIRWIDVASELAFLVMDLDDRNAGTLAQRVLNRYLQESGDYLSLKLLRFYQVYRAMVKAKVSVIRAAQRDTTEAERQALFELYQSYINLATRYTRPGHAAVIITHGVSGAGKSTLCQQLAELPGIIWIRSDIERKRLHGLEVLDRSHSPVGKGLYGADATDLTYERLLTLSKVITEAQFTVLVDATFLSFTQRQAFRELARTKKRPFLILNFQAGEAILHARIQSRQTQGGDPSEASADVLRYQLTHREPLSAEEQPQALTIDSAHAWPLATIKAWLASPSNPA